MAPSDTDVVLTPSIVCVITRSTTIGVPSGVDTTMYRGPSGTPGTVSGSNVTVWPAGTGTVDTPAKSSPGRKPSGNRSTSTSSSPGLYRLYDSATSSPFSP